MGIVFRRGWIVGWVLMALCCGDPAPEGEPVPEDGKSFWEPSGNSFSKGEPAAVGDPCEEGVSCDVPGSSCWPPGTTPYCARVVATDTCAPSGAAGTTPCCNPIPEDEVCETDAECAEFGELYICALDKLRCGCDSVWTCVVGCETDADCMQREGSYYPPSTSISCTHDFHCVEKGCGSPGDCPEFYDCTAGDEGTRCTRQVCETNDDCEDGTCVANRCFAEAGTCLIGDYNEFD